MTNAKWNLIRRASLLASISGLAAMCVAGAEVQKGMERTKSTRRPVATAPVPCSPCTVGCQIVDPAYPTCADLAPEKGPRFLSKIRGLKFPQIFGFAPVARFEGGKPLGVGYDEVGSGATYRGYETDNQIDFEPEITGRYNKTYLLDRNTGALYADPVYLSARRAQAHWNRKNR